MEKIISRAIVVALLLIGVFIAADRYVFRVEAYEIAFEIGREGKIVEEYLPGVHVKRNLFNRLVMIPHRKVHCTHIVLLEHPTFAGGTAVLVSQWRIDDPKEFYQKVTEYEIAAQLLQQELARPMIPIYLEAINAEVTTGDPIDAFEESMNESLEAFSINLVRLFLADLEEATIDSCTKLYPYSDAKSLEDYE